MNQSGFVMKSGQEASKSGSKMVILLPTDFSRTSINAIYYALDFVSAKNTRFVLYHTFIPFDSAFYGGPEMREKEIRKNRLSLKSKLERLKSKLQHLSPGHTIDIFIDKGAGSRQIIAYSAKQKVDLIIMGTTGSSGLKEKLIGSVTNAVISKSHCPVLAVPSNYKFGQVQKILVPTVFTLHDIIALKFLTRFPATDKALIHLLHVSAKRKPAVHELELYESFKKAASSQLKSGKKTFSLYDGKDREQSISTIVKKEKIDLLIMTTSKRKSFLTGFFNSSLTSRMAHHTRIPLIVFPVFEN